MAVDMVSAQVILTEEDSRPTIQDNLCGTKAQGRVNKVSAQVAHEEGTRQFVLHYSWVSKMAVFIT